MFIQIDNSSSVLKSENAGPSENVIVSGIPIGCNDIELNVANPMPEL
jgi:hypothetical protein